MSVESHVRCPCSACVALFRTIHATAYLGREVDVKFIAKRANNAVYCPVRRWQRSCDLASHPQALSCSTRSRG